MPEPELEELIAETRQACKGLIRQARAALQLASALEERLASRDTEPTAEGGTGTNGTSDTHAHRAGLAVAR